MKNIAIKENHLYNKAYKNGAKFVGRYVCVYVLRDYAAHKLKIANPKKEYVNRIGLSVSSKTGGAVVRNRIKRVIRAGLYPIQRTGKMRRGKLIVIAARSAAVNAKSTDIERELNYAFEKLDMFEPQPASGSN